MPTTRTKPVVLLTGFGPFPGVPHNASAQLVRMLAPKARRAYPSHSFAVRILKTEWETAPQRAARLQDDLQPALALHFGVATGSASVRLESCGLNICRKAPDAAGRHPAGARLIDGGADIMAASIPVTAIAERLARLDIPVSISDDAGGYICNAVLYHALCHSEASGRAIQIGFIHVPDDLKSPPVTLSVALRAGLEIIDVCLHGSITNKRHARG